MAEKVVTRFPPSPTGYLHIGGVRTALFNYLFSANKGGEMWLRFEDTDKQRSRKEFEDDIFAGLNWLDIPYKLPEPYRQSERTDRYRIAIDSLIKNGHAFPAGPSKDVDGEDIIQLKNPGHSITFTDLIRGDITFDTKELGDITIAKGMSDPLYHLTVVVDDAEMGVTHVIRGEDHISNTARQILILEALGYKRPVYAHIPLILAADRSKLSKRHGAVSVNEYREKGYLPEALINYLALLGWNPGGEQEVFSLTELIKEFSIERVHKSGAIFDIEKLKWFNAEHIKRLSDDEFKTRFKEFAKTEIPSALVQLIKERAQTLAEAVELLKEFDFMESVSPNKELLLQGAKAEEGAVAAHLEKTIELLEALDEPFTPESVKNAVFPYATEVGRGAVLWPMRTALSGREKSPDPFTLAALLGKDKTISRLKEALGVIK